MKLELKRIAKKATYTIGQLFVDGLYFCDTLEDPVRDLEREKKIPGMTAIPTGTYEVIVNISPKFKRKLPRLLDVPDFEGILIHRGNSVEDTAGCILVGENRSPGKLIRSTISELRLTQLIEEAMMEGERVVIEIK